MRGGRRPQKARNAIGEGTDEAGWEREMPFITRATFQQCCFCQNIPLQKTWATKWCLARGGIAVYLYMCINMWGSSKCGGFFSVRPYSHHNHSHKKCFLPAVLPLFIKSSLIITLWPLWKLFLQCCPPQSPKGQAECVSYQAQGNSAASFHTSASLVPPKASFASSTQFSLINAIVRGTGDALQLLLSLSLRC